MKRRKTGPDKVTQQVVDTLRSLGLVDEHGQRVAAASQNKPAAFQHHIASSFGAVSNDSMSAALDDGLLSTESRVPISSVSPHNVSRHMASFGPVNKYRTRMAVNSGGAYGGGSSQFGRATPDFSGAFSDPLMSMYSDPFLSNNTSMFGFSMSRANPYMVNRYYGSGMYGDIPVYFMMMQEQNGGLLYWPINIREKYSWLRYFARTDPFVGAAIDLHTDMPMSRIGFTLPKLKNDPGRKKAHSCLKRVKAWADRVNLFDRLMEGFYEYNVLGQAFIFADWSNEKKEWQRLTWLPPEEIAITRFPFSDLAFAMYRPEPLIRIVGVANTSGENTLPPIDRTVYENLPNDVKESISRFGAILMDTDPFSGKPGEPAGSFVAQVARKRSPYTDCGVSILERVIVPLLQKEHFKYTQLSLASRLMTPRNKVNAPGVSPEATDYLRSEIDMSMEDPDYHVVTNFDFSWDQIGAGDRLIQLQPEYDRIENELITALGVTKELLSGEASYGGTKITLDILNTRYLLVREIFQNLVEKKLLYPMAVANDWFEVDEETGERVYYYPKLTFNRLAIRDNSDVFDSLFQLYQKGSVPIEVLYELFNLDPDEMNDKLVSDLFTPRDNTFNELLRAVHTGAADDILKKTDVIDRITATLGLKKVTDEGKPDVKPLAELGTGNLFTPPDDLEVEGAKEAPEEGEALTPEEPVGTPSPEEQLGPPAEVEPESTTQIAPDESGAAPTEETTPETTSSPETTPAPTEPETPTVPVEPGV